MNKLVNAYSGSGASRYDRRRARTSRWKAENAAFEAMLTMSDAASVLDCPFGTGRWIEQYTQNDLRVVGVDLSAEMLAVAKAKVTTLPERYQALFSFRHQSIFDLLPDDFDVRPDVVVCIRFLNWISQRDAEKALRILSDFQSKELIIGASVLSKTASPRFRRWYGRWLAVVNACLFNRPNQYVHDEEWLLQALYANGWKIAKQAKTMKRDARINYLFHCTRAEPSTTAHEQ